MENYMIKTAESVSPKHPDKLCDQVSDAILDACLEQDRYARVAIETMGGHGKIFITGEVTTSAIVDYYEIANRITGICDITTNIVKQSPFISQGVDIGGAGDQGIMVGYACSDTESMLPIEVDLSRRLCKYLYGRFPYDGKTQVTVEGRTITDLVASFQNTSKIELEDAIKDWIDDEHILFSGLTHVNPSGDWSVGGFDADTGLTGRKIVVDAYGPFVPVGGGAFSGKDPTKVDRSGAYMARKVAVDYLKKRKAKEVYCYLSYAIGYEHPTMADVLIDGRWEKVNGYNLTPEGIINELSLRDVKYEETAKWGHFGNGFCWDTPKITNG
jgi:S-adenosylmethionine synthetase